MSKYTCESEELELLADEINTLMGEKEELLYALKCVLNRHQSPIGNGLTDMDVAHIRALLSRLGGDK